MDTECKDVRKIVDNDKDKIEQKTKLFDFL